MIRLNVAVGMGLGERREVGGNDGLIDPGGRTWRLSNDQPRRRLGRTEGRKGGTARSRWMRSRVMLLKTNVSQACSSIPLQN